MICAGRHLERLTPVAERIGPCRHGLELDVADRQSTATLLQRLPAELRAIDILINNAGHDVGGRQRFDQGDLKEWASARRGRLSGGFAVTLDCPNDRYINDRAICEAAAAMLGKVGIRVTVAARPMREHCPRIRNRQTDVYMLGWGTTTRASAWRD